MRDTYTNTFLWHDYETWGINPAYNGPAQFAAIRTDSDLNPIGDAMMFYCKPPLDALPQPAACLVTGITPQKALQEGVNEAQFIRQVHQAMMQPQTCSVGYNSMRFDDEVTRFALYRNFYDAYQREWQNGNSRWDLIDVVRLCAALRPDGIEWPKKDDGAPSYKLEALTFANQIEHAGAHDALADVRATIAVAKLIKSKQSRLFDYALSLRNKQKVASLIEYGKPLFHISSMFGNQHYCASVVLPLCAHPSNKNVVIAYDLRYSPKALLSLASQEDLAQTLFSKADQQEGERVAIKNIHLNKCPMIAPVNMLDEPTAQRIGLDLAEVRRHYDELQAGFNAQHQALLQQAFSQSDEPLAPSADVDELLYRGGFFSNHDKQLMQQIVRSSPEQLAQIPSDFQDKRLPEMLFRYRARNFPDSLNSEEQARWLVHCQQRIITPTNEALVSAEQYQIQLEAYFEQYQDDEDKQAVLNSLADWLDALLVQI